MGTNLVDAEPRADGTTRWLYRDLYRIRSVEEEVARVYPTDAIKSPIHLSIGQESVSVGVCAALRRDDVAFGTYRGHALYLAKGGNLRAMIAELYGRRDGCARGKAGSMHLIDTEAGVMGTSAVVGTTLPQAVGYALALKMRREPRVVAAFFGEGATEEGVYYESVNFAAQRELPVLFVCENNGYAICADVRSRITGGDLCARAASFGLEATRVAGGDVFAIREAAREGVEAIRSGRSGPRFLECETYRWREHVGPDEDWSLGYRSQEDAKAWMERDWLHVLGDALPSAVRQAVEAAVDAEIRDAFAFAEASPYPDGEELWDHVHGS